ncbi:MAG TPA: hypothetical protein VI816_04230, partial [Candidatus Bathyarchaeia archaeon]|nr:hypothetical protein [Candidatus Bathyarchaeia archaeon]
SPDHEDLGQMGPCRGYDLWSACRASGHYPAFYRLSQKCRVVASSNPRKIWEKLCVVYHWNSVLELF